MNRDVPAIKIISVPHDTHDTALSGYGAVYDTAPVSGRVTVGLPPRGGANRGGCRTMTSSTETYSRVPAAIWLKWDALPRIPRKGEKTSTVLVVLAR